MNMSYDSTIRQTQQVRGTLNEGSCAMGAPAIADIRADEKGQQHPKDFPGGHPPQYYPGLARLNFGVRMGSGAFDAVWPLTRTWICTLEGYPQDDRSIANWTQNRL